MAHLTIYIFSMILNPDFPRPTYCAKLNQIPHAGVHLNHHEKSKFAWQSGYAIFSVSNSAIPRVAEYIINQEEHHRKVSFKEEYLMLLDKHKIEYDQRYIFD